MTYNPDIISDNELRTHRNQVKFKKSTIFLSTIGLPLVSLYFKLHPRYTLLAALAGLYFSTSFYNTSFMTSKCSYSTECAIDSVRQSQYKLAIFNEKQRPNPNNFWKNLQRKDINYDSESYLKGITRP